MLYKNISWNRLRNALNNEHSNLSFCSDLSARPVQLDVARGFIGQLDNSMWSIVLSEKNMHKSLFIQLKLLWAPNRFAKLEAKLLSDIYLYFVVAWNIFNQLTAIMQQKEPCLIKQELVALLSKVCNVQNQWLNKINQNLKKKQSFIIHVHLL